MFISKKEIQDLWNRIGEYEDRVRDLERQGGKPANWWQSLGSLKTITQEWRDTLQSRIDQALGESSKALARIDANGKQMNELWERLSGLEACVSNQLVHYQGLDLRVARLESTLTPTPNKSYHSQVGRSSKYMGDLEQINERLREKLARNRTERAELQMAYHNLSKAMNTKLKDLTICRSSLRKLNEELDEVKQSRDSWLNDWREAKEFGQKMEQCNENQLHTISTMREGLLAKDKTIKQLQERLEVADDLLAATRPPSPSDLDPS